MRTTFLAIFLTLWSLLSAQSSLLLQTETGETIPFACTKVTKEADTRVYFSDADGVVHIDGSTPSIVIVQIDAFGYETFQDTLKLPLKTTLTLTRSSQQLGEVVITGQMAQRTTEEAVHQVRVVNKQRIAQLGSNNVSEVLSREMNIRIGQDNILGSGIEMQGVSGQNIKVLIDGVPMVGRLDGNIDLSQIDINSVERIEVVQGPLSVQYGTDALGGTINIITRNTDTISTRTANISAYYESVGQYNTHGNYRWANSKHTVQVNGSRQYFDGWNPTDASFNYMTNIQSDSTRFQSWKPKLQYTLRSNYDYRANEKLSLGFNAAGFYEEMTNRGYPRGAYQESAFDDIYRTQRYDGAFRLNYQTTEKSELQILAANNYYLRTKNTYLRNLATLESQLTASNADQDTTVYNSTMSRGSWTHQPHTQLTYSLGYDFSHEFTSGGRIEQGTKRMTNVAMYTNAEWTPLEKLIIRPGLRYGYNSVFTIPLIPSLQIKWGAKNDVLRLSYARGFRAPSLKEMYFNFVDINHNIVGNLDLSPEDGHNFRAGYRHHYFGSASKFTTEVSGSYNHINNMISLTQTQNSTEYTYRNIGTYQSIAANLNLSWLHKRWKINVSGAYIGRKNDLVESIPNEFLYSPEAQASVQYVFPEYHLTISAFYKYNGKRLSYALDADDNLYQTQVDAFSLLDFNLNKDFFNKRLNISLGAKNLLDVTSLNATATEGAHSGGGTIPQSWGRSYFVKLTYHILKG